MMNFAYLIGDSGTRLAAVVDPSGEDEKILNLIREKELKIVYVIITHSHPDHTGGILEIAAKTGARIVAHRTSRIEHDVPVDDGSILSIGNLKVKVIHTPGHSPDSICLLVDGKLLTGDTLFVEGVGRTDIPGGNVRELYESLSRLIELGDDTEIYPGHDYADKSSSTIGREKRVNPFLQR